jgi:CHAT domain-containing protein
MSEFNATRIPHEWTRAIAAEVLAPLRPKTRERLRRIVWLDQFPEPEVASAALIMRLVGQYALGATPDYLTQIVVASAAKPAPPLSRDDAKELVMIAVLLAYSGVQLPNPRWWNPNLHAEHLAIACARIASATGDDAQRLLGHRLHYGVDHVKEMLETASYEPGVRFAIDKDTAGPLATRLTAYVESNTDGQPMRETLEAMPETLDGRLDLAFTAVQAAQMRAALACGRHNGDQELVTFLEAQFAALAEATAGLSRLEMDLMRRIDPDEQLLIDVAAIAKRTLSISRRKVLGSGEEITPTGLTDLIDGERRLEPGLDLYLGLAGQSYQQRVGPIVSWSTTFERVLPDGFDADGNLQFGIGIVEGVDTEFIVRTTYDGEEADSHIYYPPGSPSATLALAMLALTKIVRLDFFVLGGTRSIRHVSQHTVPLDGALAKELTEHAVKRCRELMANGEEEAVKALNDEHSGKEAPIIAFLMNDSGKSEQLLDARTPTTVLGPGRTTSPKEAAELAAARTRLLKAEAERIMAPGNRSEKAANAAATDYTALVQRTRRPVVREQTRRSLADVERLVDGVAIDGRAIVHLTIDARGLELVWVDRTDDKTTVELLTCDDVDLDVLGQALEDPEGGSIRALEDSSGPGIALGRRLAEQSERRGVDRLLICSTRHLHQLPLHALRIDSSDDRRLIDVLEVTYAPSAAIVADLARLQPRVGPTLVVAGEDLDYAANEAALVKRELGGGEILIGDQASPAAVLAGLSSAGGVHFCAHGEYVPQDYLASGLILPTAADPDGRLVAATILAEADLSGIDLAVLGACQSGAGQTEAASLDVAGGIDTAFLAAGVRNVLSALWEIDDFGALLFHGEFYRCLADGLQLFDAYRSATQLLRSGDWRRLDSLPLGTEIAALGIDLDAALAELEPGDDGDDAIDFTDPLHWAAYRLCGLGLLGS